MSKLDKILYTVGGAVIGVTLGFALTQWTLRWPDHEALMNIASAAQSVVISVAAALAGGWGVYQFKINREDRAQEETERAAAGIAKSHQEEAARIPIIELGMIGVLLPDRLAGQRFIRYRVNIRNVGARSTCVVLGPEEEHQQGPLHVVRIARQDGGDSSQEWDAVGPFEVHCAHVLTTVRGSGVVRAVDVAPGTRNTYEFLATVDCPGVYLATFLVTAEDKAFLASALSAREQDLVYGHSVRAFVVVPDV